ncbi:hypothetical protein GDO86_010326 [Hymenochirus boettgeri]|uniref:RING-type E3 ubiquitin transferase n=1 Tax=Hymenochirus boettgeri TaxID=247094 RepID=A0A8T2JT10_9PIPI|nr:hypothetical protein GDO86_010326 [Hymenochirus boettgeri]
MIAWQSYRFQKESLDKLDTTHSRTKTLVNKELWEIIQKQYPKECRRRASGQETDDLTDDITFCPAPLLCKPGEIRQEYEAEVGKIEAERLAQEEAERKASEAYIEKLLAEEEAEVRHHAEAINLDIEEQLRRDEELARSLSGDLNLSNASSTSIPPASSKKMVSKSCKVVKRKQHSSGDIERFLSPKLQRALDFVRDDDCRISDNMERCFLLNDYEDEMTSPQSPNNNSVPIVESDTDSSQESSCFETSQTLNGSYFAKNRGNTEVQVRKKINVQLHTSTFSPYQERNTNTPKQIGYKETPKRKSEECIICPEDNAETSQCGKKTRLTLAEDCFMNRKLTELEEQLFERRKQEEQDRLLALQMQREWDKELRKVNREKGSPDEYHLRSKREQGLQQSHESSHSEEKTVQHNGSYIQNVCNPDENKRPSQKKRSSRVRQGGVETNNQESSKGVNVLKPSNKQPTILDLFQRSGK